MGTPILVTRTSREVRRVVTRAGKSVAVGPIGSAYLIPPLRAQQEMTNAFQTLGPITVNVWKKITAGWTVVSTNGLPSNGSGGFTVLRRGYYRVHFTVVWTCATSAQEFYGGVDVNGAIPNESITRERQAVSNRVKDMTNTCLLELDVDDVVTPAMKNITGANTAVFSECNFNVVSMNL